ncbi:MAG: transcription-repair coupling factor [Corynebacterium sp.]|nr:transcription-repair coupling factor [Corynebacterium sp.]
MLQGLLTAVQADPKLQGLSAQAHESHLHITGVTQACPWTLATLGKQTPVLVVVPTARYAEDLSAELRAIVGDQVAYFPAWETLPHERLSPAADIAGKRAQVLAQLRTPLEANAGHRMVITTARGFAQPVLKQAWQNLGLLLSSGQEYSFSDLHANLVDLAYKHVDLVAKPGEFATRGGIVDIYPTTQDYPVRLEFWGDELQEIREFSVADQRTYSQGGMRQITIYPARELLLHSEVRERAGELAQQFTHNANLYEVLHKIADGIPVEGMESLMPALAPAELVALPSMLAPGSRVVVVDPERVHTRISDLQATDAEFLAASWEAAALGADAPMADETLDLSSGNFRSLASLEINAEKQEVAWWTFSPPGMLIADEADTLPLDFSASPSPRGEPKAIEQMMEQLRLHTQQGGAVAFIAPAAGTIERMAQRFREERISAVIAEPGQQPQAGVVMCYQALSYSGLVFQLRDPSNGAGMPLVVLTETDITGNRVGDIAGAKRCRAKRRNRVDPLALQPGDYVVHETHGIGRFIEMTERTIGSGADATRREYVVLEYAPSKRGQPGDRLYVPMDSLDLLSKYVGGEKPGLSKMGGSDWKNTKRKARGAVREIAAELVQLYAKRQAAPGYAFQQDSRWQHELEDAFAFVETEDQMTAIEAVKEDMEKTIPMDRVVVGDVGYGKTEVAVRAAFKAVQDGKQVAMLVPTTLLAQQHLATFSERMVGFPVTIRGLSRFSTNREAKETLAGLADGSVDIVIGTHRLLQTGVQYKDLGLVIIDEEQRFGVENKEHIKALRSHIDVLTMSATPIPRTLEMSMVGIRDMSTILTPPQDRHPILTSVGPQDDKQIAAAIRRELLRDGQVFYIHNRVRDIEKCAQHVRELVPEARVVVAHGQMTEEMLEATVQGFWDREFDVLICTTIVETGLDIANANTLIVEDAHHMGLSQLHQLRGRVGRSRSRGYAYFLYPQGTTLTEQSYDRLATIAQNNDLGAGMAVAMKDLEMRGAGNVLGAEQSGHIAGVGFDLYVRLVGEAVETFRAMADGKPVDATSESKEVRIDLPVDAHIPDSYINAERLRLEMYRKLATARDEAQLQVAVEEMQDRYGPLPLETQRLLALTRLRILAQACAVTEIIGQANRMKLHPVVLSDSQQVRLKRLVPQASYRPAAQAIHVPLPKAGAGRSAQNLRDIELLQWVADFLAEFFQKDRVSVDAQPLQPSLLQPTAASGRARQVMSQTGSSSSAARRRKEPDIDDFDSEERREQRRKKYRLRDKR